MSRQRFWVRGFSVRAGGVARSLWKWITDPHRPVRQLLGTVVIICALVSLVVNPEICISLSKNRICVPVVIGRATDPRDELRQCTNVQLVEGISNGWAIKNLPDGVYGYATPGHIRGNSPEDIELRLPFTRSKEWRIEVHKISRRHVEGIYIVGYVSHDDLAHLNNPERHVERDVVFYVYQNNGVKLVALKVEDITISSQLRYANLPGNKKGVPVLDMTVKKDAMPLYLKAPECSCEQPD